MIPEHAGTPTFSSSSSGSRAADAEVLLFDLGGVIVRFSGIEDLPALMRRPEAPQRIRERWIACPHVRRFEIGASTTGEFAEAFAREWDLAVEPADFLAQFRTWARGLLPGAAELLASLRGRHRLAALSNSNELHWESMAERGLLDAFEIALSSHHVGHHKPEREIYEAALARLGVAAERVTFFDDSPANVEAARALGMRAAHVRGPGDLAKILRPA